ncbi:MAG: Peroxisomal membrane signal receptor PTS1 [Trizodia sp. TS-e1964]|nr:MAG: Peroxisomal membrane signal receptor PTS1 [Trizodia sp. TS-e1964]
MSFIGGGECSTAANPLRQFTKQVQDDKSLQRDRLLERTPISFGAGIRGKDLAGGEDKTFEEFLQQTNSPSNIEPASPYIMEYMRSELEAFPEPALQQMPGPSNWASEFGVQPDRQAVMPGERLNPTGLGFGTEDFFQFQQPRPQETSVRPPNHVSGFARMPGLGYGLTPALGPMPMHYRLPRLNAYADIVGKGKGRMTELDDKDWESQFAQIAAQGLKSADSEANLAIEKQLDEIDKTILSETNDFGDLEAIWQGIAAETTDADNDASQYDLADLGDLRTQGSVSYPQPEDYIFEKNNLFDSIDNPFDTGLAIMNEGGNLSLAALAFEAAVQKDPQHVAAWSMLGTAQAQNEKEIPAIRALEQALKIDPGQLDALMGLAVAYTNESYDTSAFRTLEQWLSVKYPQIIDSTPAPPNTDIGYADQVELLKRVTKLFIKAAQLSPDGEHMDPDVQVGLGVLFYGAEDYTKAVDCFSAALASTESGSSNQKHQLHLLWNRLGATLANSGRSEEAITAYEKALMLRPNFVRARYNLGVSCINIGCLPEAAQHLLEALAMHKVVEKEGRDRAREVVGNGISDGELERMIAQNQSTTLYETLRRVFILMGRRDLVERVVSGMDIDSFRDEFSF